MLPTGCHDLISGHGGAGFGHHFGVYHFAEGFVRNPEDRDFEHGWIAENGVLDFGRIDIFTPGNDHVLGPIDDKEIAIIIGPGHVATGVPTVTHKGLGRLFRTVPVAHHDVRAPHMDLARFTGIATSAVGPADLDFNPRHGLSAAGQPRTIGLLARCAPSIVVSLR